MGLSRRKPVLKNRVPEHVEQAVIELAIENPALGQKRASWELQQQGIMVPSSGARSIWLRNDLETMKKRLKALEARAAQDGILLTEAQMAALEKAQQKKEAHGEIESHHPGYLGSQDTYYVGTMKGVGRIYQQTFVDTYARVAICKLYTAKTAITAADLLNDRVIPFFAEHGIGLLRILTDRGTEYCGKVENHAYQLYLAVEDVDHTRTKANSAQTNRICERFHRTIKDEFYDIAFRKNSTGRWRNCRSIWTPGWPNTTSGARTREDTVTARRLCRPSAKRYTLPRTRQSGLPGHRTANNPFSAPKAEVSVRSSLKFYS